MLVEWSDNYSIGIDEIDGQHKGFFQAAHQLYNAIMNAEGEEVVEEMLEFLKSYAFKHFQTEEALMERHNYPGIEAHKKLHADFLERVGNVTDDYDIYLAPSQEMADGLLEMTQDWLIDHITDVDTKYAKHVKQAG